MKKSILSLALLTGIAVAANAQNTFPATGNTGIGTLSPATSLQVVGTSRFGSTANYSGFDAAGNFSLTGTANYKVTGNRYAFQLAANPNYGLFFNQTIGRYEFRNGAAAPVFYVNGDDGGNGYFSAGLQIGNSSLANAGNLRWTGTDFEGYNGTSWVSLTASSFTETDPQVGTNTTSFVPRWNGTALVTGLIQDNGSRLGINKAPDTEHRFSVLRQATSGLTSAIYSAIRGENNAAASTTINSAGYLGVDNPSGMYPIVFPSSSFDDIGALGIKHSTSANEGAGLYGWNQGGAGSNYGVFGTSTASSGNNYGVYGKTIATNSSLNYALYGESQGAVGNYGVYAKTTTAIGQFGYAVFGSATGTGTNYAGFFSGHTYVGADDEALTISGTNPYIQFKDGTTENAYVRANGSDLLLATNSGNATGKVVLRTNGVGRVWVDATGNVSIGSSAKVASGYLLSVVGKVMAEEVRVELNGTWPDYVFAKDYKLMPLQNLKQYVMENNHLPEVPAAEEMKDGIEVGKMNKMLMQKVEELTLYIIQLNEEVQELKKQNK